MVLTTRDLETLIPYFIKYDLLVLLKTKSVNKKCRKKVFKLKIKKNNDQLPLLIKFQSGYLTVKAAQM